MIKQKPFPLLRRAGARSGGKGVVGDDLKGYKSIEKLSCLRSTHSKSRKIEENSRKKFKRKKTFS
jgi:hypothetical protein